MSNRHRWNRLHRRRDFNPLNEVKLNRARSCNSMKTIRIPIFVITIAFHLSTVLFIVTFITCCVSLFWSIGIAHSAYSFEMSKGMMIFQKGFTTLSSMGINVRRDVGGPWGWLVGPRWWFTTWPNGDCVYQIPSWPVFVPFGSFALILWRLRKRRLRPTEGIITKMRSGFPINESNSCS